MICSAGLLAATTILTAGSRPPLLSPQAAASALLAGKGHRELDFATPALVAALRRSLYELGHAGQFRAAVSHSSDGREDNLRSAVKCKPGMPALGTEP